MAAMLSRQQHINISHIVAYCSLLNSIVNELRNKTIMLFSCMTSETWNSFINKDNIKLGVPGYANLMFQLASCQSFWWLVTVPPECGQPERTVGWQICCDTYINYRNYLSYDNIDGLVQERHNSIVVTMELYLSCINPLISSNRFP